MDLFKDERRKKTQWIRYFENESEYETITSINYKQKTNCMILAMLEPTNQCHYYSISIDEFPIIIWSLTSS